MKYVFLLWVVLTFAGPIWQLFTHRVDLKADYRTANRNSAGIAPRPHVASEAIIQFYSARAFNWRGLFASHCWIAVKPKDAESYTVYQVVGWLTYQGLPALSIAQDLPDRYWYNAAPNLFLEKRGLEAEALIPRIETLAKNYPYAGVYTLWPGPNSNSFPAYIGRNIPELGLVMPADAVGKDFLGGNALFAATPSGTGYQLSLWGVAGISLAKKEGLEINLLGLTYAIRFSPFSILLPGLN